MFSTVVKLAGVQEKIRKLTAERDELIREAVKGGAGVREVARYTGLSPAQVSRISRR